MADLARAAAQGEAAMLRRYRGASLPDVRKHVAALLGWAAGWWCRLHGRSLFDGATPLPVVCCISELHLRW
jgi:hypothetical protein